MAYIDIEQEYTRCSEFLKFARTPAFAVWVFLRGQVVRDYYGAPGAQRMYHKYFMAEKWLCASYSVENIAIYFQKFHKNGKPDKSWVSRYTKILEDIELIKKHKDGRKVIYQLGYYTGEPEDKKEIWFFDKHWAPIAKKDKEDRHIKREEKRKATMSEHCEEQLRILQL